MATSRDELKSRVLTKHYERVIRLRDEVDNFIKLIVAQREAIESEWGIANGFNFKNIEAMEALIRMLNTATTCKLRLEKAEKTTAESMTPEQERAEIKKIIQSWETNLRYRFLKDLGDWHRSYADATMAVVLASPRERGSDGD
jgi:hypothetical protein